MNIASLLRIAGALVLLGVAGCGPEKPKTSLHQAVQKGDLKVVQQHIAARSDLNVADKNGWVPLHFAAMKGELAIVKALAAGGADLSRTGPGGRTPLDMAREKGQVAVAKFLMSAKPVGGNGGQGRGLVDGGLGVSEVLANP